MLPHPTQCASPIHSPRLPEGGCPGVASSPCAAVWGATRDGMGIANPAAGTSDAPRSCARLAIYIAAAVSGRDGWCRMEGGEWVAVHAPPRLSPRSRRVRNTLSIDGAARVSDPHTNALASSVDSLVPFSYSLSHLQLFHSTHPPTLLPLKRGASPFRVSPPTYTLPYASLTSTPRLSLAPYLLVPSV